MATKKKKESIAICLNCYKIHFKEKNKPNSVDVNTVFGTSDMKVISQKFIKVIDTNKVFVNDENDRIAYLQKTLKPGGPDNIYAGIIMKGHNGPQTSIDALAGSKVQTIQTVSSAHFHCLPYLFLLYTNPKDPKDIIFIAQSYRQFGFKEVFEEAFKSFMKQINPDLIVKIGSLSVAKLFEDYVQNGFIKSLRFTKYGLSKNLENIAKGDNMPSENYTVELKVNSEKGFKHLKPHLKYDDSSFIEQIQFDDFDYNVAHAEIFLNGRKRIVNVSKPQDFVTSFDITEHVTIDYGTKLPDFNDVLKQALETLNEDLIPYV